jgi:3-oxoacyl-[acyl-carrier protein] reductase
MADLSGKVALVSGASRGIGRAYALALAEAGVKVVALARTVDGDPSRPGNLAELVATARARGGEVFARACDIGDEAGIVEIVRQTVADHGGVDILLNNAIWPIRGFDALKVSLEEWATTFRLNVGGAYVFMREAVPQMIARGGGSIINMTTASAQESKPGTTNHGYPAYAVTKAGLERLTTYFAAEFEDRNIAVNAISPGNVSRYMQRTGRQPDLRFWGAPILHLAQARPGAGPTGQVLHTYEFGRSWGPKPAAAAQWDEEITTLLREFEAPG